MKMDRAKYETIKKAIAAVVQRISRNEALLGIISNNPRPMGVMWQLFEYASHNIQYDDNHPGFATGQWPRVYPTVPGFNLYSGGLNDDHIDTALKSISKELDLFTVFPTGKCATDEEQRTIVRRDREAIKLAYRLG